jgi:hypothetical protein
MVSERLPSRLLTPNNIASLMFLDPAHRDAREIHLSRSLFGAWAESVVQLERTHRILEANPKTDDRFGR